MEYELLKFFVSHPGKVFTRVSNCCRVCVGVRVLRRCVYRRRTRAAVTRQARRRAPEPDPDRAIGRVPVRIYSLAGATEQRGRRRLRREPAIHRGPERAGDEQADGPDDEDAEQHEDRTNPHAREATPGAAPGYNQGCTCSGASDPIPIPATGCSAASARSPSCWASRSRACTPRPRSRRPRPWATPQLAPSSAAACARRMLLHTPCSPSRTSRCR